MPDIALAVSIIVAAGLSWDVARRWMMLTHGRMLTADKSQALDRAVSSLQLQVKKLDSERTVDSGVVASLVVKVDRVDSALNNVASSINEGIVKLRVDVDDLQSEIDKRDKTIASVAEEVKKLNERETARQALSQRRGAPALKFGGSQQG